MRIRIAGHVLGTERPLAWDTEERSFSVASERDDFIFDGNSSGPGSSNSLDDLFALEGYRIDSLPPKRFVDALALTDYHALNSNPMWSLSMPHGEYRAFVRRLVNDISVGVASVDDRYFRGPFCESSSVLRSLQRACVDRSLWSMFWMRTNGNSSVGSFEPDSNGYASPATYDRLGTRTGRLRIINGPQALNLPKESRQIIVPSREGGCIVSFDYVSFEAQIALAVSGRPTHNDVYDAVKWEVFGGEIDRDRAKAASLALLFGAGNETLAQAMGLGGSALGNAIEGLMRFFGLRNLQARLMDELKDDRIRSYYGRSVHVPESSRHLIVNSYVQATAVDAALLGFVRLLARARELDLNVRPLFVIHDALMIDCPPDCIDRLGELSAAAMDVSGFDSVRFPCRIEKL